MLSTIFMGSLTFASIIFLYRLVVRLFYKYKKRSNLVTNLLLEKRSLCKKPGLSIIAKILYFFIGSLRACTICKQGIRSMNISKVCQVRYELFKVNK